MSDFQQARDGLAKLLKDTDKRLNSGERDDIIVDAARQFSRRVPRVLAVEVSGDGGFDYALPTGFVEEVSDIREIYYPYEVTSQQPDLLELKDWTIFQTASARKLRFLTQSPPSGTKALVKFTAPHSADPTPDGTDTIGTLSVSGTVLGAGASVSSTLNVESAADARVFVEVAAASGTLVVTLETSPDQIQWATIAQLNDISAIGNSVELLGKHKLSKYLRLSYSVSAGGSFTIKAVLERESTAGTLTVLDAHMDAFNFLSTALACQALADFYAGAAQGTLSGDVTNYEGKTTYWKDNHDSWMAKFESELERMAGNQDVPASATGEWDLTGSVGFRALTHPERYR